MTPEEVAFVRRKLREVLLRDTPSHDYAGHRTDDPHDCFLMQCHTMADEIDRLRSTQAVDAERMEVAIIKTGDAVECRHLSADAHYSEVACEYDGLR